MRREIVFGGALVLASASLCASGYDIPAGRMKAVSGEVTAEKEGALRTLRIGDPVYAGERIQTASSSSAALMLRDDTRMSLGEKSSIRVERFEYDTTKQDGNLVLSVFRGVTAFVSGLLTRAGVDRVQVQAPTATIGVRGTEFIIEVADGDGDTKQESCTDSALMRRGCWGS